MVHIGTTVVVHPAQGIISFDHQNVPMSQSILVVRDDDKNNEFLDAICDFLDIGVEHASSGDDLLPLLVGLRPMAVITDLDGEVQDGFHVMKMTAGYNRKLPIMLLTDNDPVLLGAVDAVRQIWDMPRVATVTGTAGVGEMVDFICRAARDAGKPRLMRVYGGFRST